MGQRSRKRATPGAPRDPDPPPRDRDAMSRGYARSRERDDAIRARLEPYAPGERPAAVKVSAALAALIGIANVVLYLAGWDVRGQDPNLGGALALCVVLLAASVGMWRMKYWAVLGFEVLLGVLVVSAALSLMLASNLRGALLSLAVIVVAGPLFWLLIRVMARIQLPARRR